MCQSKAEGGRRCAYHLQKSATSGITAYAASMTGLNPQETTAAYNDLLAEGVHRPAPTREEVDDFLTQQEFRVRHETGITEAKRESILNRIRAAIGRVLPDGATFHAWRNIVAESWTRVRRKASAAFLVGAIAFSTGACGVTENDGPPADKAQTTSGAPVTPGAQAAPNEPWTVDTPTYHNDAIDKFGRAEVSAATNAALNITQKYMLDESLANNKTSEASKDELDSLKDHMTPDTRKSWQKDVTRYTADENDTEAGNAIRALVMYDVKGADGGYTNAKSGPLFINKKITGIETYSHKDYPGSIFVKHVVTSDMRLTKGGVSYEMQIKREASSGMQKIDGEWKLSGWHTSTTVAKPKPVTK